MRLLRILVSFLAVAMLMSSGCATAISGQTGTTTAAAPSDADVEAAVRAYVEEHPLFMLDADAVADTLAIYGASNGWAIFFIAGYPITDATYQEALGSVVFYSDCSPLGLYATDGTTVFTLSEAYEAGVIDIEEVYQLVPASYRTSSET